MKLAINGGAPIRNYPFPAQISTGMEEKEAVARVLSNGRLTGYQGNAGPNFKGGHEIQALEQEFSDYIGSTNAIPCNSATSGLWIACGAIGLEPGDEVIVSPWSMSCSATMPLLWGATPVFSDVEKKYYCLDADSIESKITEKTKAIIVVSLFGQSYDVERINAIAEKHHLWVIEDAAQSMGASYNGKKVGTHADITVFSFNWGKNITCGEGGMIVVNHPEVEDQCRLLMNHAEAVVHDNPLWYPYTSMVGMNLRMTEMQAAILREQLKKLDRLNAYRIRNANMIANDFCYIPGLIPSVSRPGADHVYYVQPFEFNSEIMGVHRDRFIDAVKVELAPRGLRENEGVPVNKGYVNPLYNLPCFSNKNSKHYQQIEPLPVVEELQKNRFCSHLLLAYPTSENDCQDIINAFYKVYENRSEL